MLPTDRQAYRAEIVKGQRVADALMRAAQRGVECRLLVDAVGSKRFFRSPLRREMQAAGVRVVEALQSAAARRGPPPTATNRLRSASAPSFVRNKQPGDRAGER